ASHHLIFLFLSSLDQPTSPVTPEAMTYSPSPVTPEAMTYSPSPVTPEAMTYNASPVTPEAMTYKPKPRHARGDDLRRKSST
ncbi:MAG: hypothetical protein ACK47M_18435, partial [Caldilinea sp.]